MRISDWSSDVCSSDLRTHACQCQAAAPGGGIVDNSGQYLFQKVTCAVGFRRREEGVRRVGFNDGASVHEYDFVGNRSEERRVGTEGVSTWRYRVSPYLNKKKQRTIKMTLINYH